MESGCEDQITIEALTRYEAEQRAFAMGLLVRNIDDDSSRTDKAEIKAISREIELMRQSDEKCDQEAAQSQNIRSVIVLVGGILAFLGFLISIM